MQPGGNAVLPCAARCAATRWRRSSPAASSCRPATQDFFPDDEGNTHEDNINRLAAAGITEGLEDGTYDPAGVVTRAQMGSFLARAMELDPIGGDRFDDVSGVHEANINAIAAAGVTEGCNEAGNLYCPSDPVRRDQMASFIGRALGLEPIDPPPGTTTTTIDGTTTPQVTAARLRQVTAPRPPHVPATRPRHTSRQHDHHHPRDDHHDSAVRLRGRGHHPRG